MACALSQAIGEVLVFGVGVACSPVAIIAVLRLVTGGAQEIGSVFVAVWCLTLGALGTGAPARTLAEAMRLRAG